MTSGNASTGLDVEALRALIEAQTWGHDDDLVGPFRKDQIEPLLAEVERLRHELAAFRDEVEFAVNGGTDVDGPLPGMDGLDVLSKINVLHSTAVEAERTRATIERYLEAVTSGEDSTAAWDELVLTVW